MAVAVERYKVEWVTPGLARYTNNSDMAGRVSASHWFAQVAAHLLRADGVNFQVTYAQMNILLWITGDFGDGSVANYPWTQVGVEIKCGGASTSMVSRAAGRGQVESVPELP